MTQALTTIPNSAPSRRTLFSTAAATAVLVAIGGAAPLPPPRLDAELIQACRAMMAAQRAYDAIYDGPDAIEDDDAAARAAAPFAAQWETLLPELERLRASTSEGIKARAAALAAHNGHFGSSFDHRDTMTGRMLDYLLRDAAVLAEA